ncbi:chemotaxis protein [Lysobacteraceae bacterium NML93-0399]|nr:chemotaxis protein [Xanthomonadaceae bacterium NML93-0399]
MTPAGVVDDYLGMLLSTAPEPVAPARPANAAHMADVPPSNVAETASPAALRVDTPSLEHAGSVAAEDAEAQAALTRDPEIAEAPPAPAAAGETVSPLDAAPAAPATADPAPVPAAPTIAAPAPPPAPPARPAPAAAPMPMPAPAARQAVAAPALPPAPRAARAAPSAPGIAPPTPQRRAGERMARWLRLRCGPQTYALELLKIREVVLPSPLLPLRGAAPCLAGVMNLRGQVVPVVDLGLQLGDAAVEETTATRVIVLEDGGDVLGLRVSSVEDVVLIGDAQIEGTHTSRLAPVGDHRIRGIARLGGTVMLLLDSARLMALPLFQPR